MATASERDAQRAAELARDLEHALMAAFPVSADGKEMVDIDTWKAADVPEMLRRVQHRIEQVLPRLSS